MLAPPSSSAWLDPNQGFSRESRSNSCVSDSAALLKTPSFSQTSSRRPSALSIGALGQGQRAFLIRQKSTGEEVVVTMNAVRSPGIAGGRPMVGKIPSYLANAKFVSPPTSGINSSWRSSCDDEGVNYDSLMSRSDISKRFSEMVNAQDVIAVNRLEKIYQQYRKQAHAASDETMAPSAGPLAEWMKEKKTRRRQSCAVGEFGRQTACRSKSPYLGSRTRAERAHSIGLVIPTYAGLHRSGSKRSNHSSSLTYDPRIAGQPRGGSTNNRSRSGSSARYIVSEDLDSTRADLEAAAEALRSEFGVNSGVLRDMDDELDVDMKPPPEKERRRIALIVSCVALAITFFAASLVGLTLGLSHLLEGFSTGKDNYYPF